MKESVLHYIWQYKLFVQHDLWTSDGEPLEVIDVGKLNSNAGPDFFNAKIRIGKTIWAGNVEIHSCSSDWNKHKHQTNPAFSNVILHVAKKVDVPVFLYDGERVPQLELRYADSIEQNYAVLMNSKKWVPCCDKIIQLSDFEINHWKTVMLLDRLSDRVQEVDSLLAVNRHFWEETLFCQLCKGFGFSVNRDAFYSLAKSIPWGLIEKHQHNLVELEALLFGQSGLLSITKATDDYTTHLMKEYAFLKHKYQLHMISPELWRLLRLRPANFPHIRIAQLASLLHHQKKLFSKITDQPCIESLIALFSSSATSEYWESHYLFGVKTLEIIKRIGLNSIHQLIINAIVPVVYSYANYKDSQLLRDKVCYLFEVLPPENNYIIRKWHQLGLKAVTAADSQSLIHLYKAYCEDKKCLRCCIGFKLLTSRSIY